MEESLDAKVNPVETFCPVAFCALAVKLMMFPNCTDVELPGLRVTFAGNWDAPAA
jgi:hypothetical protein